MIRTPARCQAQGVREVCHLFHIRELGLVNHWVAVCIVIRVVLGPIAPTLLPHVIQSSVVVSQLCQRGWLATDGAQGGISEGLERELHELLVDVALVLVPVTPCSSPG